MKESPLVPVIFTARVVFHDNDARASLLEWDQRELLRYIINRLRVVQAAIQRVEGLRRIAADASKL